MFTRRIAAVKTISLGNSTYKRLKAAKRSGASFSQVIDRLLDASQNKV